MEPYLELSYPYPGLEPGLRLLREYIVSIYTNKK